MPLAPKRPCTTPRCPEFQPCPKHSRQYDRERGSAAHRGYDHRWRKYRRWFMRQVDCECGRNHALCEHCQREGRLTLTFAVDHIVPHRGDPDLFWSHDNHSGLCESHHNSKSAKERLTQ